MSDDKSGTGGRAQLLRSIFEQNVIGVVLADLDGTIIESNAAFSKMTGYTDGELRHLSIHQLTHPDDLPDTSGFFNKATEPAPLSSSLVSEKRYLCKDGGVVWARIHATIVRDALQAPIFAFAIVEDITERKHAEERLAAEKERLAVTLRSIGDAVISTDAEGRVMLFNKVAETLTGWKQDEAHGRPLADVLCVMDRKSRQPCEQVIEEATRNKGRFETTVPLLLVSHDGVERCIAGTGNPIFNPASASVGMVFAFRDVTEKARLEGEQARTEKLESLGHLAGGIAHDFNNHLTAILGNISLAKTDDHLDPAIGELLTQAEEAALQARGLTQQLLTFAKGGAPIKEIVPPRTVIEQSAEFALRGSSSRLEIGLPDSLWPIEIDPSQIEQVIRHLVINADQAMPGGGKIVISPQNKVIEGGEIAPLGAGRYVEVVVNDSGVGIPEQYLDKIFDPYFTTKPHGSGLGLAASLSVIKNHGGHITVDSQVGKGACFHVYLPAVRAAANQLPSVEPENLPADHPRVLVMDDEDAIRQLTTRILSRNGFRVETAPDGAEALRRFQAARDAGQPFDVVILDLTIRGGMGGKDTMRRLQEIDPDVRVIVSSGYSNDPIMSDYRKFGFRAIVAKPYQTEKLVQTVRTVAAGR